LAFQRGLRDPEPAGAPRKPAVQGFDKAWNAYQQLPPVMQRTTARNVAMDPVLAEQLRVKLQGSSHEVAQALKMIAALPNLIPYRNQIIQLCGHGDPRVAAIAVSLVGRLEDPRYKDLLEAAAHHADARVRANAVESMEQLHIADRSAQVLAMLNSRHNRERANAIKALGQFNFATARECLQHMLLDSNPLHRMSALWVVGQLNIVEIMRQVSNIARRDPNLRVRKRALEMLETLSGTVAAHS
jgi:HEAT repeat protein